MRYSNLIGSLPHPVLFASDGENSYADNEFVFRMLVDRDKRPHQLQIEYDMDHLGIQALIDADNASVALAIHCQNTYYYKVIEIPKGSLTQSLTFPDCDVMGHVYFNLLVMATRDIPNFKPAGLREGFDGLSFNIRKGDVLAISNELDEYYALPPMRIDESIFLLELQPELDPESFIVDLQGDKIKVGVGSGLNDLVQRNMETKGGRVANIGTVYFPALIEALYQIREEVQESSAWFEALNAAANRVGVESLENSGEWNPLTLAQQLLKNSHAKLLKEGR